MPENRLNTSVVGTSPARLDAPDKATGRAMFVDDYSMRGMLHGAVVRCVSPRAVVTGVDLSGCLAAPGVAACLDASDIPGENVIPVIFRDMPCLAEKEVRFAGEPVAVVAADTREHAREAAGKAKISVEELPLVLDPEEALNTGPATPVIYGDNNCFSEYSIHRGDVDAIFAGADFVVENRYRTPCQEHAYLETQGMIASMEPGGVMRILGSMQCPFYVREAVAAVLGFPLARVQVVQAATGGAFGGKEDVPSIVASQAALLAWKTGRPVKLIYTREEDMISMSKRHPGRIRYRTAVSKDGRLLAMDIDYILDAGAYATLSPVVLWRGAVHACGPYKLEGVRVRARAAATNKAPNGAFRGFGSPQILFAVESQVDAAAAELGLDPVEFRLKNFIEKGDETPGGQTLRDSVGLREAMETAVEKSSWGEKRRSFSSDSTKNPRFRRGIGCSAVLYGVGLGAGGEHLARTGAYVQVEPDGSALFAVGTTEMGQGMTTVLGQIVAEELGLDISKISMMPTDTSRVPDSGPTVASRSTTMSGNALRNACSPVRRTILEYAAKKLHIPPGSVSIANGRAAALNHSADDASKNTATAEKAHGGTGKSFPITEIISDAFAAREVLSGHGWYRVPHLEWRRKDGLGEAYITYAFAANIAEVEVDTLTGEVRLERLTAAHDVGKAINPREVRGQIEGGSLQGAGYALLEQIVTENGTVMNSNFSTYIIPTAMDAPAFEPLIVEAPFPGGPFGAKGFGEQPLMGVAPAVTAAIFHAVGARVAEIPATPERVLGLIKGKPDEY